MQTVRLRCVAALLALGLPLLVWGAERQVVDIDVQGMTCPFCVHGLQKSFAKAPEVDRADASLKEHKVRVVLRPGAQPDLVRYKQLIRDAGFTPGESRISTEETQ